MTIYHHFSSRWYTFRASSSLLTFPPLSPQKLLHSFQSQNTETEKADNCRCNVEFIPSGIKTQKIKRIDHRKCNVRASKNAEQAFSTQRYLYSCDGLFFLFSSIFYSIFYSSSVSASSSSGTSLCTSVTCTTVSSGFVFR